MKLYEIIKPKFSVTCSVLPNSWCNATDLNGLIILIANWFTGLVGSILAIVILVSAVQVVTSAGNPGSIQSAKRRLGQAALSLGLLISFRSIIALLGIPIYK
ncbi:MAG: hypothetical protein WCH00_02475 [Candidatus Saccharibacteria bacterium]